MAIPVVDISREGHKIRKVLGKNQQYSYYINKRHG
jgi:hypothetical protein